MLCKHCDGTGTSNWCINGTFKTCEHCNGSGEAQEQTNEEWFATLTTEDKAWTLAEYAKEFGHCAYSWEDWLKAVHKE